MRHKRKNYTRNNLKLNKCHNRTNYVLIVIDTVTMSLLNDLHYKHLYCVQGHKYFYSRNILFHDARLNGKIYKKMTSSNIC